MIFSREIPRLWRVITPFLYNRPQNLKILGHYKYWIWIFTHLFWIPFSCYTNFPWNIDTSGLLYKPSKYIWYSLFVTFIINRHFLYQNILPNEIKGSIQEWLIEFLTNRSIEGVSKKKTECILLPFIKAKWIIQNH